MVNICAKINPRKSEFRQILDNPYIGTKKMARDGSSDATLY
jgi:hypothetical protein